LNKIVHNTTVNVVGIHFLAARRLCCSGEARIQTTFLLGGVPGALVAASTPLKAIGRILKLVR
jgi:hypothetical protein